MKPGVTSFVIDNPMFKVERIQGRFFLMHKYIWVWRHLRNQCKDFQVRNGKLALLQINDDIAAMTEGQVSRQLL